VVRHRFGRAIAGLGAFSTWIMPLKS